MTRARVETLAAGHLVPMEQPALVADAVIRFAGEV
jgi:pimeloyl-ACP methyl ester carboxylesterase